MDFPIGIKLMNRFVIEEKLDQGAFGRVFRATDRLDGSPVAVKFSFGRDDTRKRNIVEAKILRMLNRSESPYRRLVVELKASFVFGDCVALVMELLPHNFRHSIESRAIEGLPEVSTYARQMLEFLLFLNQMGVTHGDIKPENMLHEASGDGIKFADFGLSHCLSVEGKPKRGGGTYSYMAPEIALGYDHHSSADVWSVGCVLVECLTKKKLFCSRSAPELLRAVTRIVGSPSQRAIANAPRRCRFYWHNDNSGLWILDGSRELAVPIGLRRYLQIFHGVRVDDLKCTAFIDLVEGMLRLDPSKRSGPEALLAHPFFTVDGTALDRAELARLREICTRLDLSTGALCEAVRLYEGIKVEPAIRGREKAAVILACLYVACLRRKEVVSKRKFAKASGLDVRYVDFMSKTILEVSGLTVQPPTRKWDIYECLRPIVDWLAS